MRQRRDLRALQVRVRGQHGVDVVGRASDEELLERGERRVLAFGDAAQVQPHVRDHLVVAAAPGVQPGAGVADELGQPALDGHVHVLVGVGGDEGAGLDLPADGGEAGLDGLELGGAQDAGALQRPRVRDGALDVLGPQAPVERQRAVQRHERRRALAGEAARAGDRHRAAPASARWGAGPVHARHHTRFRTGRGAGGRSAATSPPADGPAGRERRRAAALRRPPAPPRGPRSETAVRRSRPRLPARAPSSCGAPCRPAPTPRSAGPTAR